MFTAAAQAFLAVWLVVNPGALAQGLGPLMPDRAVEAWSGRTWYSSERGPEHLIVTSPGLVPEDAAEDGELDDDDDRAAHNGALASFGSCQVSPSSQSNALPCPRLARPRPLFLLCGRLTC